MSKSSVEGMLPVVLEVVQCKWMPLIIEQLAQGVVRPAHLRRALPGISFKILYERLRRLEEWGMVRSQPFDGYPRRTDYHLTAKGRIVSDILRAARRTGLSPEVIGEVLKCRWLREILVLLGHRPHRPSQMKQKLEGISNKVLAEKLQKLERLHLISRSVSAERPPAVWYRLEGAGERVRAFLDEMERGASSVERAPVRVGGGR
ncbi:MAG: hypothetical protein D6723_17655 [Acidobacteria bacterium]|nr:MAG: hypothetical protein D6723_17655 [Acidobacteriota bacterium]